MHTLMVNKDLANSSKPISNKVPNFQYYIDWRMFNAVEGWLNQDISPYKNNLQFDVDSNNWLLISSPTFDHINHYNALTASNSAVNPNQTQSITHSKTGYIFRQSNGGIYISSFVNPADDKTRDTLYTYHCGSGNLDLESKLGADLQNCLTAFNRLPQVKPGTNPHVPNVMVTCSYDNANNIVSLTVPDISPQPLYDFPTVVGKTYQFSPVFKVQ